MQIHSRVNLHMVIPDTGEVLAIIRDEELLDIGVVWQIMIAGRYHLFFSVSQYLPTESLCMHHQLKYGPGFGRELRFLKFIHFLTFLIS